MFNNSKDIRCIADEFVSPSVKYRGKPFWSWNGELREEELVRQAHIMKQMGLGGYFMHSRAGLITEYLGDEWFELINKVADVAESDGMEAWLYDEDRWPSGSAGGKVTIDPQYRVKSLCVRESSPDKVDWDEYAIALYVAKLDGIDLHFYRELEVPASANTDTVKALVEAEIALCPEAEDTKGEWKALKFSVIPSRCGSNYNGTTYIDTMNRAATDRFIELTHEEYKKRCGDRLGKSIKGIFTDEPHRGNMFDNIHREGGIVTCSVCWTNDIFEEFERRYGFNCRKKLPELFYRFGGEKVSPVKLFYIDLGNALFVERFMAPINEWCESVGIKFTGHGLHENSLVNQTVPCGSIMRLYEHMGYPGIDALGETDSDYWTVKQAASVVRQLNKKWLLSELYGCTGWQFDFKGHKAVGDWQALFGVNLRCQHLSWYTMEGESGRDYPGSILHQSPWYKEYRKLEDYFARLGVVLTEGTPQCDVLVINPVESAWCQAYIGWSDWIFNISEDIKPLEENYRRLFYMLTENHIDFDYGDEEMMSRLARVEVEDGKPYLYVGHARYKTAVVSNMLTIRPSTLDILKKFMSLGGSVIFAGDVPTYVNAVPSNVPYELSLSAEAIKTEFDACELASAVRKVTDAYVSVRDADGNAESKVFAQVRERFGEDGYACVILNVDRAQSKNGLTLELGVPDGYYVEEWDLETGERYCATDISRYENGKMLISTSLEAAGSRCFVLSREMVELPCRISYRTEKQAELLGEFDFYADEQNACVLDWCRYKWNDGEWSEALNPLKLDRKVRSDIGIELRGGSMLQPWYAKIHDKNKYGKITLSYEFFIDTLPKSDIILAAQRPELNHYRINGTPLEYSGDKNDFWIDDCFKRMPIPMDALRIGRNEIIAEYEFMRTSNIESIYLVGDFGVKIDGKKVTLVPVPIKLGCKDYSNYDLPFFSGNMTFILTPDKYADILGDNAKDAERIVLSPKCFYGSCIKVSTEGGTSVLAWDPYEADVTDAYRKGETIYVTVMGTRINVFGPLHQVMSNRHGCGPGSFITEGDNWSDDYVLYPSGIRGFVFKTQKSNK